MFLLGLTNTENFWTDPLKKSVFKFPVHHKAVTESTHARIKVQMVYTKVRNPEGY